MRDYSPEAKRFYKSKEWKQCRIAYIKSVGGLCERCLKQGLIVPGFYVHHKEYITADNIKDPRILLDWNNLEYLCRKCHNEEHFQYKHKRYNVKRDGTVEITGR